MKSIIVFIYPFIIIMGLFSSGCRENRIMFAGGFTTDENRNGLVIFEFSDRDGSLKMVSEWDAGANPSYFCFSDRHNMVYALNEVMKFEGRSGSGLTTFKYNTASHQLEKRGELTVPYGGGCHISLSTDGGSLFIASYASGSVAVVKLGEDGIPEKVSHSILYEAEKSGVSHAHMILQDPEGKRVYVTDLGLNRIMIYNFDSSEGKLIPLEDGTVKLPEGSGPRHFVFNSTGTMMYVINELGSTVMALETDTRGMLYPVQILPSTKEGFTGRNSCADLHISENGRFLYGSNRGENSIVTFSIDNNGLLTLKGHTSCGGDWPRNFVLDPSGKYLLAGNQRSDNVAVFRINPVTGMPDEMVSNIEMNAPACLKFY